MVKRGRPKKEVILGRTVNVRLSEEDFEKLFAVTQTDGETFSDVMRKALKFYYFARKNGS